MICTEKYLEFFCFVGYATKNSANYAFLNPVFRAIELAQCAYSYHLLTFSELFFVFYALITVHVVLIPFCLCPF